MDLNELFFRHQIALMRVDRAENRDERSQFCVQADWLALRIGAMQHRLGAETTPLARALAA